jgi:hypothetical protein
VSRVDADSKRIVTVTVETLKAFETAVRARYDAERQRIEASHRFEAAKLEYERALRAECEAVDADVLVTIFKREAARLRARAARLSVPR